ncbi:NAD-binding protein [Thiovibrio frasassiensis]|uniref:NAD-binding protein n=1 Tax=Thiovibrio frasassiensis TaxID=2984131 RepID=A0A9X4RM09_9BACT|nr:NAD-binding protein [Thiovibrio frasassiensis]MDG4475718.1 NAD-binding protein [Thiovibrio frasassiensis]
MKPHRITWTLAGLLALLLVGIFGYMWLEDFTLIEALYMSIITLTSVGFGEVRPLSDTGRLFTTGYILLGFSGLAFASHALVGSVVESVWTGGKETKKMQKKIAQLKSHFILCGYGRVGAAAAEHFKANQVDFVIIENSAEHCQHIMEQGHLHIHGDATHEETLRAAGIKSATGLIALLNKDPDNLFVVLSARELNPTLHIISRAEDLSSEHKILRAGADNVISPFASAGIRIAEDLLVATGRQADKEPLISQWVEVQKGSSMAGITIEEVSRQMGARIFGLRRDGQDTIFPEAEISLLQGDQLLVLQDSKEPQTAGESMSPHKVVIVDDNPVILRLYSRLLQKAGFIPLPATNGQEGLALILKEKPAVAVIDFILPLLSGIEICKKIRNQPEYAEVKLLLFTADERAEIKQQALDAGADLVIRKGPESSEIIEAVQLVIKNRHSPTS